MRNPQDEARREKNLQAQQQRFFLSHDRYSVRVLFGPTVFDFLGRNTGNNFICRDISNDDRTGRRNTAFSQRAAINNRNISAEPGARADKTPLGWLHARGWVGSRSRPTRCAFPSMRGSMWTRSCGFPIWKRSRTGPNGTWYQPSLARIFEGRHAL